MELSNVLETSWGRSFIINVLQYAIVSFKDYLNGRTICITLHSLSHLMLNKNKLLVNDNNVEEIW